MVASRNRRTEEHKFLIASFRIRKDLVKACSKASPSASKVFCAGGGIAKFPFSERTILSRCKTFQARNRLCFDDSGSSRKPAQRRMRAVPTLRVLVGRQQNPARLPTTLCPRSNSCQAFPSPVPDRSIVRTCRRCSSPSVFRLTTSTRTFTAANSSVVPTHSNARWPLSG